MERKIEEIFNTNYKSLLHICYLHTGNKQEAEEVIQEVFIKYMDKKPNLDSDTEIKKWLIRVAINRCIDIKRRFLIRLNYFLNAEQVESYDLSSVQIKDELLRIMDKLDDKTKMAVILKYALEMDYKEISEYMNIREGTLKSMVSRAMQGIRGKNER